ncbi:MAG: phosphatidate cytidylyltransferase [Opitutaceae bacterium]
MARRVLSTVLLWGVVFVVVWYFRTKGAVAALAVISGLTLREFYRLQDAAGRAPFHRLGIVFGVWLTAAPYLEYWSHGAWPAHPILALAAVIFALRILSERRPEQRADALCSTLFGLIYVSLLLQYLVRMATPAPGDVLSANGRIILVVWTVAVAKFCDTGALLCGSAWGRHRMAPNISPKKTWEGVAGGVAASVIVGAFIAWCAKGCLGAFLTPGRAALIALPIAAAAIVSDLIESVLKRQAARKDSGRGIPGIGGIFDVTDSLLLTAPVAYVFLGFR